MAKGNFWHLDGGHGHLTP